ncbi:hypothetical protein [Lacinutrix cladophorae]
MKIKLSLILILILQTFYMNAKHIIPESILKEANKALEYFPQLQETNIEIKFKKNIKKSTMQARPTFGSFFRGRKNRKYIILISESFKISNQVFKTKDIPSDILVGWIGHELGHILDYQKRSKMNLIRFGINYLFSENSIVEAERAADTFAVAQGMEKYILKTKNFILNHADITLSYKNRIKKFYLSPEEIMILVENRDKALVN